MAGWYGYCCIYYHFQQYFRHIVAVIFIGGGNQNIEKITNLLQVTEKRYHIHTQESNWKFSDGNCFTIYYQHNCYWQNGKFLI